MKGTIKKTILALFPILFFAFQATNFSLVKSIPVKASFFTTDNLGNAYIVKQNILEKYDNTGVLLQTFSDKNLGNISSVDASDPLKLILFYKDFSQLIFLDNMLSPTAKTISLENIGFQQARLVCSSHNNGIWLYNQQNFELIHLDQNFQLINRTGNISQLLDLEINPNFLAMYNNRIYLNNPLTGILIFDSYGTYYKTIPLKGLNSFQLNDNTIFYLINNEYKKHNTKTLEEQNLNLPDSLAIAIQIQKAKVYLLKEKSLDIYQLN